MDAITPSDYERLALDYLGPGGSLTRKLGQGIDGVVYFTSRNSALKVHCRASSYANELAAYQRLRDYKVKSVGGHAVPELFAWSDAHRVIEMEIVHLPYLLDFATASLDEPFDYPDHVMRHWHQQLIETFGTNWTKVLEINRELINSYGIYHGDLSPRNCGFLKPGEEVIVDDGDLDD